MDVATLTGGDWHHAPALSLVELTPSRRRVVSNGYAFSFEAKHLSSIEPALRRYARTLLKERGLPGPLVMELRLPDEAAA